MSDWERRIDAVWADAGLSDDARIALIDELAAERAPDDPRALFERAGARDSAGLEIEAEVLYRQALAAGLDGEHRPQAVIQLASTLRNLGRIEESLTLLQSQRDDGSWGDETSAFYALALADAGREREAVSVALLALAPHLSRYTRSVTEYAGELGARIVDDGRRRD